MTLVAIATVPLAPGSRAFRHRSTRERAIAAVLARGGQIGGCMGDSAPGNDPTPAVRPSLPDLADDDLTPLAAPTDLEWVDLSNSGVGDAGLRHLAALPRLRTLLLDGTRVTDDGLRHLSGLTTLTTLKLPDSITNAGLAHLGSPTNLPSLDLSGTRVTGPGLPLVKRLPALKTLDLAETDLDDSGVAHRNTGWDLESLSLASCPVGDDDLFHLGGLDARAIGRPGGGGRSGDRRSGSVTRGWAGW